MGVIIRSNSSPVNDKTAFMRVIDNDLDNVAKTKSSQSLLNIEY